MADDIICYQGHSDDEIVRMFGDFMSLSQGLPNHVGIMVEHLEAILKATDARYSAANRRREPGDGDKLFYFWRYPEISNGSDIYVSSEKPRRANTGKLWRCKPIARERFFSWSWNEWFGPRLPPNDGHCYQDTIVRVVRGDAAWACVVCPATGHIVRRETITTCPRVEPWPRVCECQCNSVACRVV